MVYTHTHAIVDEMLTLSCAVAEPASNGQSDGSVTLSIAGGGNVYDISWTGPQNGNTVSVEEGDITISDLSAGDYIFTVNSDNETASCNITVPEKPALNVVCTLVQSASKDQSNGSVMLTIEGGNDPYIISWVGPQSGNMTSTIAGDITISNLPAGDYIFSVTAGVENATCSITVPKKQTINAGDCITLGDDLPSTSPEGDTYCYKWSPTTYFDSGNNASDKVITTCPTNNVTYTVTVTDGLNITETREYEICVEGGGGGDDCNFSISCLEFQAASSGQADGIVIVNIDGAEDSEYEVVWNGTSDGNLISDQEQVFLFNLSEGSYDVTVTNISTDCSETCTITIDDEADCGVIAVDDVFVLDLDGNKTSVKLTINVKNDLLVNDKYPDGSTFELECNDQTNLALSCAGSTIGCSSCEGVEFIVEASALGTYEFEYLIKGCDGASLDRAKVRIVVSNCHENEPENSCNLVRNGDFECFTSDADFRDYTGTGNFPQFVFNDIQNTPDRITPGYPLLWNVPNTYCCADPPINNQIPSDFGSQAVGMYTTCKDGELTTSAEGMVIELSPPIQPGQTIDVSMYAEAADSPNPNPNPDDPNDPISHPNSCLNLNPRISINFITANFDISTANRTNVFDLCTELDTDCTGIEYIEEPVDVDGNPALIMANGDMANGNEPMKDPPVTIRNNSGLVWTHIVLYAKIDCINNQCGGPFGNMPGQPLAHVVVDDIVVEPPSTTLEFSEPTINPSLPCEGSAANIVFEICNTGNSNSGVLTAELDIPDGYTLLNVGDFINGNTVNIESLAPSECRTLVATVIIGVDLSVPGIITLTISGDCIEPIIQELEVTPLSPNPPIALEKSITCIGDGTFNVDITVTNLTEEELEVEITDLIPFGTFMVMDPMDFSVSSGRLMLTTTLGMGSSATFSYIMQSNDVYCGNLPAPCAFAEVEGCALVQACPEIEDCRIPELIEGFSGAQAECSTTNNALVANFNANATGSGYTHTWDFGDGNTGTGKNPMHTYTESGVYSVTHTVSNGCEEATTTQEIPIIACDEGNEFCYCPDEPTSARIGGLLSIAINNIPPNLQCLEIQNQLRVDIDASITNIQIAMHPGASILVLEDNSLTITRSELFACEEMWNGITVVGDAALIFKKNSIRDALYAAINLEEDSRYDIRENTFDKNYVGLRVFGTPIATAPLEGNTFTKTGPLNNGGVGFRGIEVNSGTFIIGNQSSTGEERNKFQEDINIGVFVNGSSQVDIHRASFQNITSSITSTAWGVKAQGSSSTSVYNSDFTNIRRGIESSNTLNLSVEDSQFDEVYIGIIHSNGSYNFDNNNINFGRHGIWLQGDFLTQPLSINENTIEGTGDGILIWDASSGQRHIIQNNNINASSSGSGIELLNSNNIEIRDNPMIKGGNFGIRMNASPNNRIENNAIEGSLGIRAVSSPQNFYCNNSLDGGTTWSTISNVNQRLYHAGLSFTLNCDNSTVSSNQFQSANYGLYCYDNAIIGQQPNTQNSWLGENDYNSTYGAFHEEESNDRFVRASLFTVDPGTSPSHSPDALFEEDFIDANDCTASANISETDGLAARAAFSNSTLNWESARYLWRKMDTEEGVLGEISPVDSFYLATQEEATGQLQAVERYVTDASKIDQNLVIEWTSDLDAINDWLNQISQLEVDYQNATSDAQRDDIIQQRKNLTDQIAQTVTENVQEQEADLAENRSNLNFAYQLNEQLTSDNSFAINEQFVNRLAILSLYDTDFELKEADRIELLSIANECPETLGSIVFRARSLYEVLTEEEVDFDCEL